MGKSTLKCIICHNNPREIPDRYEGIGRPIKRICRQCHAERLREDLRYILAEHKKKNERTEDIIGIREGSTEL